jgi:hypothetical protein
MSTQVTEAVLVEIELDKLTPNPWNLRRSVGDVKALTKSIAEVGIVVPLIVTPAVDGTYLLAAGERRLLRWRTPAGPSWRHYRLAPSHLPLLSDTAHRSEPGLECQQLPLWAQQITERSL